MWGASFLILFLTSLTAYANAGDDITTAPEMTLVRVPPETCEALTGDEKPWRDALMSAQSNDAMARSHEDQISSLLQVAANPLAAKARVKQIDAGFREINAQQVKADSAQRANTQGITSQISLARVGEMNAAAKQLKEDVMNLNLFMERGGPSSRFRDAIERVPLVKGLIKQTLRLRVNLSTVESELGVFEEGVTLRREGLESYIEELDTRVESLATSAQDTLPLIAQLQLFIDRLKTAIQGMEEGSSKRRLKEQILPLFSQQLGDHIESYRLYALEQKSYSLLAQYLTDVVRDASRSTGPMMRGFRAAIVTTVATNNGTELSDHLQHGKEVSLQQWQRTVKNLALAMEAQHKRSTSDIFDPERMSAIEADLAMIEEQSRDAALRRQVETERRLAAITDKVMALPSSAEADQQ